MLSPTFSSYYAWASVQESLPLTVAVVTPAPERFLIAIVTISGPSGKILNSFVEVAFVVPPPRIEFPKSLTKPRSC